MRVGHTSALAFLRVGANERATIGQASPLRGARALYTFREVMIPMRDGVRLQTVILTPTNATGRIFETGSNVWRTYQSWPPASTPTKLYLHGDGSLRFTVPTVARRTIAKM